MRPRHAARTAAALAAVLVLAAGCSDDDDPVGPEGTGGSSSANPSAETPVTLERLEVHDPGAPPELVLTHHGTRRGRYLLSVTPPGIVGIAPTQVELAAGEEAVLRLVGRPAGEPVTVTVVDAGSHDEVATLQVEPVEPVEPDASPTPPAG
ncbi:hypothetical protein [Nocardioides dongkuii]|uniref:hypothetical protein n=1 Tax=Nocardioides dongkuii TaxID=2760089 RepID=UPI0015F9800E|nr:hypothetical protein [Nocardioides dongkuii]